MGVGCFVTVGAVPSEPWRFVVGYLAVLNLVLAGFNMIPAFPLDGGRVLRALLGRTRSHAAATELAVSVGKSFAVVLAILGIVAFNPFLVAVAFFVYIAAAAEGRRTALAATFEGVRVADVMTPASELSAVEPTESIAEVLDRMFGERHTGYPVLESGRLVGVVTLSDVRDVALESRTTTTVEEVMSTDLETVGPDTEAMEAMTRLERVDIGRLPVVDRTGTIVGLVTRSDLVTAITVIRERRAGR